MVVVVVAVGEAEAEARTTSRSMAVVVVVGVEVAMEAIGAQTKADQPAHKARALILSIIFKLQACA